MIKQLFHLFFPKRCTACKNILVKQEQILCLYCLHDLPLTNLHKNNASLLKQVFYGSVELVHATALFYYTQKGTIRAAIHQLKYRGAEDISGYFGRWLGTSLLESNYYNDIDVVVPVPIHKKRLKERGYNQVTQFGKAISKILKADYNESVLLRVKNKATQTKKDRLSRWKNTETVFHIADTNAFQGKHILLVDDVITTGATIIACVKQLQKTPNIRISLAVMAYTK